MTASKPERRRVWVRATRLSPDEKAAIGVACERLIAEVLKPQFLPEIRPTQFNYPVDILGKWRGSNYSFIVRFRSGFPENAGEEFDATYARLDHVAEGPGTRFDVMWHRHTGQWWRVYSSVTLEEALHLMVTEGVLRPPV
ncbi:MAG: hypothetical protein ACLPIX_00815 [Rhodomicrobium sp.]